MASGEELWNTFDRINAIMWEASTNCLHPEIPYPTLPDIPAYSNQELWRAWIMDQHLGLALLLNKYYNYIILRPN